LQKENKKSAWNIILKTVRDLAKIWKAKRIMMKKSMPSAELSKGISGKQKSIW
jgi:hypothetical protein